MERRNKIITVNVSEEFYRKWKGYIDENCINSSKLIAKLIGEHIKSKKE